MHRARQLTVEPSAIRLGEAAATREDVLPDWHRHDRRGAVMTQPFGASAPVT